jgi:heavy metal sensor kinase
LTKRSLKPVIDMSLAASGLGSDDLSVRLPLPAAHDELRSLAKTFNEMLDRLEDAFLRLRRFTGDVSHELRTPLAVLRGEAEFALRRERPAADYRASLQTIVAEANNMTGIIEDLLLLARAESKAVAMSWLELSTVDFVAEVAGVVQPVFETRKVDLRVVNRARGRFSANPGYLTLALKNILLNAAKHSAATSTVELLVEDDGRDTLFTITDSGEGIPSEALPYIFDPFYRADTARNRAAGGTGIGLSLALALVKLHGGTITVRSAAGEGASFTVRIPAPPTDRREQKLEPMPLTSLPTPKAAVAAAAAVKSQPTPT